MKELIRSQAIYRNDPYVAFLPDDIRTCTQLRPDSYEPVSYKGHRTGQISYLENERYYLVRKRAGVARRYGWSRTVNLPAIYIEPAIADTVDARLTIQYCHDNGHEYESLPEKFIRQRRPGIESNCIAVASVPYCLALFRYFDATPEPLDPYPEELHHILHRRVIRTTLGLVPPDYSGFIRPVSGAKLWQAASLETKVNCAGCACIVDIRRYILPKKSASLQNRGFTFKTAGSLRGIGMPAIPS